MRFSLFLIVVILIGGSAMADQNTINQEPGLQSAQVALEYLKTLSADPQGETVLPEASYKAPEIAQRCCKICRKGKLVETPASQGAKPVELGRVVRVMGVRRLNRSCYYV